MRGHMRCLFRSPRIHSIYRAAPACLLPVPNRLVSLLASSCVPSERGERLHRSCLACFPALMLSGFADHLCLLGVASRRRASDEKKAGGDVCFPVRLFCLLSDVIYALVVVVQIALLTDDIAVRSARADMRVCVAWLELLAHTEAVRPAFDI